MIVAAAILSALLRADPEGLRLAASGALERPDAPSGASLWREGGVDALWRASRWSLDGSWRAVRRWGRDDAEASLAGQWRWNESLRSGLAVTKSVDERVVASWSVGAEVGDSFEGGWGLAARWKLSDYRGRSIHQPAMQVERSLGAWRMGMAMSFPWYQGDVPQVGGKVSLGWDWSGKGGADIDFASDHETEYGEGDVLDRKTLAAVLALRQKLSDRTTVRISGAWTRQEKIHDRLMARVGMEWFFGR